LKNNEKNENKILTPDEVKFPVVPTHWGPYGGLFTTIENLKKIGLPNKELVVYADDQDYTLRFHLAGISQFLVYSSQIQDIDESIGEGGGYFSEKTSLTKLFYGLRNTTYLSKKLVTNPIVYFANKYAFFLILGLLGIKAFPKSPTLVFNRMRWFFKAFKDGENGMLGLETSL
jgi:GT2 family glycosyltransferase